MAISDVVLQEHRAPVVWSKGKVVDGYDPDEWRKDFFGRWMKFSEYGNRDSKCGWEIDHVIPRARGGEDVFDNLQPLQWESNLEKGQRPMDRWPLIWFSMLPERSAPFFTLN